MGASVLTQQAPAPSAAHPLVAALDVGVAKTVCLAARRDPVLELHPERPLRILGVGVQSAPAVASGKAADFDACARAIRVAVDQAERMAGETITHVVAAYAGPGIEGRLLRGAARLPRGEVGPRETQAALNAAIQSAPAPGRTILYAAPLRYRLDGELTARDSVLGKKGRMLAVEACVVTAPAAAIEALCACVREAGVEIENVIAAPYAAALAALTREECAQGALVLDFGAGGTGLAAFGPDGLTHAETIALGGVRMTRDLAARLETTFAAAERAKLVFGAIGRNFDPREAVETPRLGPDGRLEAAMALRGAIAEALHPRFAEIVMIARDRLAAAGLTGADAPRRAVLIGGGALLPGARELASDILGMPVRVGQPFELCGFEAGEAAPAFAGAAGMLRWRLDHADLAPGASPEAATLWDAAAAMRQAAARAWGWLRENF
ncbi:MAG: cell division protein FtsA [Hyphomonadaceae bacterium]